MGNAPLRTVVLCSIVLSIAALIFPAWRESRISANENAIKNDLRMFYEANQYYQLTHGHMAFAEKISYLIVPPEGPSHIDPSWKEMKRSGFRLTYVATNDPPTYTFTLLAKPDVPGWTARNSYCVDQTGIIVGSTDAQNPPETSKIGCTGGVPVPG
jgi:type II secretory pathway pseudopilin PulG